VARDIGAGPYDDFSFQIDAPINKGNSGGAGVQRRRQG